MVLQRPKEKYRSGKKAPALAMAAISFSMGSAAREGGREGGREGWVSCGRGEISEVGRSGCQNDGLDELDMMGREGEREEGRGAHIHWGCQWRG